MIARLGILLVLLLVLAGLGAREVERRWQQPLAIPAQGYRLTVAAGDSLSSVAGTLYREGVLQFHPRLLQAYGRWTGLDAQIKRGEYLLPAGLTASQLLPLLREGRVIQYLATIPEGVTLARAVDLLRSHDPLRHELTGADDPRIIELIQPHDSAEGLFFPDSYAFELGATDWQILQRAFQRMAGILAEEWAGRADELPYESPYEALIMASIVERETGQAAERSEIAGVFVRRLRRGMRLQTDPTVIYGLGADFDGNLRRVHLQDEGNRFNTYRHSGLPPSPIALPGRAAISAALHPKPGNSLYFVARGDGSHVFSDSLQQHQQAVRQYQLQRRKDYRSSPGKQ
jgi:UPF0755 protein